MSPRSPQIGRIARLLGAEPDGLDEIPDEELRVLHDQIARAIFSGYQRRFVRVAELSNVLPGAVASKLAQRFLPPRLAAPIAAHLDPARARDLVGRFPVDYLAELTLALDPTRSAPVVAAIPADHVAPVARALFDRGEYAAMAEFTGTVTLDGLFAALHVATAHDLLAVLPLLVCNDNLGRVLSEIPDARVDEILCEIAAGQRWDEGNDLAERLDPPTRQRVPARLGKLPDQLAAFRAAADQDRLGTAAFELLERAERQYAS